jgi:GDP-L-fucose synthase
MHTFWSGKRVLVTGGGGFVGCAVVSALRQRGVTDADLVVPRSRECDLRVLEQCRIAMRGCQVVIHLAAPTGNINFSRTHPASQFRDCTLINLNVFEAARQAGVGRIVSVGNLLAYPAAAAPPLREADVREGQVADAYLGIALSKRQLLDLAELYHREFGMSAVTVLGANAYGPHDHFDGVQAHVIPATIAKCFRDEDLVVWGDGTPTRDFLYVDDLAHGILLAGERLQAAEFVNITSGREIAIGDLVHLIARLCGFNRRIVFDTSQPGGDRRRVASAERARALGFAPRVSLQDGLQRTIDWYKHAVIQPAPR